MPPHQSEGSILEKVEFTLTSILVGNPNLNPHPNTNPNPNPIEVQQQSNHRYVTQVNGIRTMASIPHGDWAGELMTGERKTEVLVYRRGRVRKNGR